MYVCWRLALYLECVVQLQRIIQFVQNASTCMLLTIHTHTCVHLIVCSEFQFDGVYCSIYWLHSSERKQTNIPSKRSTSLLTEPLLPTCANIYPHSELVFAFICWKISIRITVTNRENKDNYYVFSTIFRFKMQIFYFLC